MPPIRLLAVAAIVALSPFLGGCGGLGIHHRTTYTSEDRWNIPSQTTSSNWTKAPKIEQQRRSGYRRYLKEWSFVDDKQVGSRELYDQQSRVQRRVLRGRDAEDYLDRR